MAFISINDVDNNFIDSIEKRFGFSLSNQYINFLMEYGGVVITSPNYVEFEISYLEDSSISIEHIFGSEIFELNHEFLNEVEDYIDCIIIGADPGGNYFLLGKKTHRIFYWDRTWIHDYIGQSYDKDVLSYKNEDDNEDDSPSIFLLFNNFAELEAEIFKSIDIQKSKIVAKET